jgi:hypothetical protein
MSSKTHFNCPSCKAKYNDIDGEYLARFKRNFTSIVSISCDCGIRFFMKFKLNGDIVAFGKKKRLCKASYKKENTPENTQNILKLFLRTELEFHEDVIDNSSPYIAKKLGLNLATVNTAINNHFKIKNIEVEYEVIK